MSSLSLLKRLQATSRFLKCKLSLILYVLLLLPLVSYAAPTSEKMVWDLVQGWLGERNARLTEEFQASISQVTTYTDEYGEQLYFVAELFPEGYVIVSPDDLIEPIIAFSAEGNYVEDSNNPLTSLVKKDMKERKGQARGLYFNNGKKKDDKQLALEEKLAAKQTKAQQKWGKYKAKKNDRNSEPNLYQNDGSGNDDTLATFDEQVFEVASISDVRIAPLLSTKWNQLTSRDSNFVTRNLYNIYTPSNYYSGCVATAIAQVLRYHSFPTTGIGMVTKSIKVNGASTSATTRGGNGSGGAYNWSIMTPVPTTVPYNSSSWNMIGALMYDAGVAVSMMYSGSGSGAYMSAVAPAFTGVFKYANAKRSYYYSAGDHSAHYEKILNSNLNGGYPVVLGIVNTSSNSGHAVVADGYGYDSSTLYHHVNMGWGGSSNAWYNLPTIGSYNTTPELIYNIFPTKTGELISGQVVDQGGNPLSGVTVTATRQGGGGTYTATTDSNGYYGVIVAANAIYDLTAITSQLTDISVGASTGSATANVINADITVVDVNPDSNVDLIWHNSVTGGVVAWLLDGTQPIENLDYGSIVASMSSKWQIKGLGDFDGDGNKDIVWSHQDTGHVYVWCLNSLYPVSQLTRGSIRSSISTTWQIVGTGDFDGDQKDDLLWRNSSNGAIVVWLMDGVKDVSQLTYGTIIEAMPSIWQIAGVGDFDGDQKDDLVWRHGSTGAVVVWLMDGVKDISQLSTAWIRNSMSTVWQIAGVGDFNGDQKDDLLWRSSSNGAVYVWQMDGTKDVSQLTYGSIISSMSKDWKIAAIGDVNADGMDDLIWSYAKTGQVYIWQMDGIRDYSELTRGSIKDSVSLSWQIVGAGNVNAN